MRADAYPLIAGAEPPRDLIANVGDEHLVEEKQYRCRYFRLFCFRLDIFHHPREILRLVNLTLAHEAVEVDLQEDLLGFFERERAVLYRVGIVDMLGNLGLVDDVDERFFAGQRAMISLAKRLNPTESVWCPSHIRESIETFTVMSMVIVKKCNK